MSEIAKPNFHAGAEVIRAQAAKIEEQAAALTAAEARIKMLEAERDKSRDLLHMFREFVLRSSNAPNYHHPIWAMVAEELGSREDICNGPLWAFIQPGTRQALTGASNDG